MALTELLFTDDARLNSYFEQIAAPVIYEKVPVWKASLSLSGPSAEGTQSRVARSLTRFEKLKRLIDFLKSDGQLTVVRTPSERRAARTVFRLDTCTAVKVRVPASVGLRGAGGRNVVLWIADPLERHYADTRHTCTLCLLQGFSKADDDETLDVSVFSALEALLLDWGSDAHDATLREQGLMALARDPRVHIDFGRHPGAVLAKLGAQTSRSRVITALYRERFTAIEDDLEEDDVWSDKVSELALSQHAMLYGYPIAIAAGNGFLT